jgi:hypothetical protein
MDICHDFAAADCPAKADSLILFHDGLYARDAGRAEPNGKARSKVQSLGRVRRDHMRGSPLRQEIGQNVFMDLGAISGQTRNIYGDNAQSGFASDDFGDLTDCISDHHNFYSGRWHFFLQGARKGRQFISDRTDLAFGMFCDDNDGL